MGKVIIGTTRGEVKVFTDDDLTELYTLKDEQVHLHTHITFLQRSSSNHQSHSK